MSAEKESVKGPMVSEFACLRVIEVREGLPGQELWLVLHRNLDDPTEIKYYFSNAPTEIDGLNWSGQRHALAVWR